LSRCARGELVYEPDLQAMLCPFPQRLFGVGLRAMVACPLLVEGRVFGVLITARRVARSFSNGECEFLGQLCAHVALAARQTQLYAALQVAYEDLRHTQQAIMRQEKLRVLGQMASGIAHDINNALSPAALYVELLLDHPTTQSTEAQDYLVIIQRAINGVAQTVARMKEFYGQRDPDRAQNPVSLNRAVEQVLALTRVRWHSMPQEAGVAIEVDTQLSPHLPAIIGDENEIRDAVTNLIINAVDAMPEGGRLSLCTHAADGGRAIVEVTDTGTGMDEATRSRCLELFFTTKGVRGTGLGLAMVYGAVERHGGELQIESAPGAGTTVRLIFPVATPRSSENVDCMTDVRPLKPLHILVVDDDPIVLQSLRTTLEQDGHVVESADGGQRGIDAFSAAMARQQPFSVVITDLGMPLVDGRAVAVAIKSMRSITRVVLLTGWGHRLLTEREVPQSVDRVLAKPPQLTRLRALLAELTNQASV
jgi:signal transduction histidine kinase/ActR/RegA family two-component response regulator